MAELIRPPFLTMEEGASESSFGACSDCQSISLSLLFLFSYRHGRRNPCARSSNAYPRPFEMVPTPRLLRRRDVSTTSVTNYSE